MLRRLAFNGVRVGQLDRDVTMDGALQRRGSWVIPMDQEFAELVRQLFEAQEYPDLREYPEGPPEQPYDAAGWTLPFQMDVNVIEVRSPLGADARAAIKPVRGKPTDVHASPDAPFSTDSIAAGIVTPAAAVTGSGDRLAVDPAQNDAFRLIGQALAAGGSLGVMPGAKGQGGRYVVSGVPMSRLEGWARDLSLRAERVSPKSAAIPATRLRIAVFKPWTASMDEGWTEWLLDRYGLSYTVIAPVDVQSGDLASRFDVILMASDSRRSIMSGYSAGTVPPRYSGGVGDAGVRGAGWLRARRWNARVSQRERRLRHQRAGAAGEERGGRRSPEGLLRERVDPGGDHGSGASAHGGHAGAREGVRGRQPGVHDDRGLRGCSAGEVRAFGLASALGLLVRREIPS
jgi:hypothetical protein